MTVIADSSTNVKRKDERTVLMRFVTVSRLFEEAEIREHFVEYYHVTDATAVEISGLQEKLLFHELGLDRKYLMALWRCSVLTAVLRL